VSDNPIKQRFNGYLPIVVDLETGGVNPLKDALLEIAAILITIDKDKQLQSGELFACHVKPFEGGNLDPVALEINHIDPYHPFRMAIDEEKALEDLFAFATKALEATKCRRAVLVGHNAHFDLSFIQAAMKRCKITQSPFHAFTCFDTATLSAMAFGQTILAKAIACANIPFDRNEAHSAIYDTKKTAELFCYIANHTEMKTAE